ncbi:DgyrCDS655 [Dimorphilus gyrociliatus]|uniref:non-specific serine/threonine protein kinase n=1 Tax=Dimorphilus gyrociliatus TaxID=2664684 RepID=A0A7I8V838_9ANNE|nr:DgyrCDS655 [Dimorphilus gyrociliatus]
MSLENVKTGLPNCNLDINENFANKIHPSLILNEIDKNVIYGKFEQRPKSSSGGTVTLTIFNKKYIGYGIDEITAKGDAAAKALTDIANIEFYRLDNDHPKINISDKAVDKIKLSKDIVERIYGIALTEYTADIPIQQDFFKLNFQVERQYKTSFKAKEKSSNTVYNIKLERIIFKEFNEISIRQKKINQLIQCKHQNLVKYYDKWFEIEKRADGVNWFSSNEEKGRLERLNHLSTLNMYIQMEYCTGTLSDWIESRIPSSNFEYFEFEKRIMLMLLSALDYLHDKKIMHKDVQPSNIFVMNNSNDLLVKMGNFDMGIEAEEKDKNLVNSIYRAPEAKLNNYSFSSDIYGLGVIGLQLFNLQTNEQESQEKLPSDSEISTNLIHMTSITESERPSARTILDARIFSSSNLVLHEIDLLL